MVYSSGMASLTSSTHVLFTLTKVFVRYQPIYPFLAVLAQELVPSITTLIRFVVVNYI